MVKKVGLVLLIIILQIIIALLLQWGALHSDTLMLSILILFAALSLHGLRFIMWGVLHRRYDLSQTYPLTALFFPLIYALAIFQGEADLMWNKIGGLGLVFIGVFVLAKDNQS